MKRYYLFVSTVLLLAAVLFAVRPAPVRKELSFFAMDTYISLTAYGPNAEDALSAARDSMLSAERRLSVTASGSEIYEINHRREDTVSLSEDTARDLAFALRMSYETGGAFNPAVYPLLTAYGFTTDSRQIPSEETIRALLPRIHPQDVRLEGYRLTLRPGMALDLGGIAKGMAGETAARILKQHGIASAVLNLGGNVQVIGTRPDGTDWRIGLQSPWAADFIGTLSAADCAVVTSGSYQRFFTAENGVRIHHLMDSETGRPAEKGLVSVTVTGPDGGVCDALSTALFVMGTEQAVRYWRSHQNFNMILITTDRRVIITQPLARSFSLTEAYQHLPLEVVS